MTRQRRKSFGYPSLKLSAEGAVKIDKAKWSARDDKLKLLKLNWAPESKRAARPPYVALCSLISAAKITTDEAFTTKIAKTITLPSKILSIFSCNWDKPVAAALQRNSSGELIFVVNYKDTDKREC